MEKSYDTVCEFGKKTTNKFLKITKIKPSTSVGRLNNKLSEQKSSYNLRIKVTELCMLANRLGDANRTSQKHDAVEHKTSHQPCISSWHEPTTGFHQTP